MNSNQKKGIGFIIGGVLSIIIIPRILSLIGLYMIAYYLQSYYIIYVIALVLIGLGIKSFMSNNPEKEDEINPISPDSNQNISNLSNTNKVVNVTLTGGIIGLIGDSPQNSLNRRIKKENANGWKVIQIIPSASGNILLIILRLLILVCTLFFYTTANGYYVIMEKKEE
jgi:uncharacterized membrane protein